MDSTAADFHILTSIGAGFFAMSFLKGMAGQLRRSIWMAALAALMGILTTATTGVLDRPGVEPVFVIVAYLALPVLSVLVSRRLFLAERGSG
jgi:hypothetical protein